MGRRSIKDPEQRWNWLSTLLAVQRWQSAQSVKLGTIEEALAAFPELPEEERRHWLATVEINEPVTRERVKEACAEVLAQLEAEHPPRSSKPPTVLWWGILCADATIEVFRYDQEKGLKQTTPVLNRRKDVVEVYGPFEAVDKRGDAILWILMQILKASVDKLNGAEKEQAE